MSCIEHVKNLRKFNDCKTKEHEDKITYQGLTISHKEHTHL